METCGRIQDVSERENIVRNTRFVRQKEINRRKERHNIQKLCHFFAAFVYITHINLQLHFRN
jgi:hypothetical protein